MSGNNTPNVLGKIPPRTLNDVIQSVTEQYLAAIDKNNPPSPKIIERELISNINDMITIENMNIPVIIAKDANGNPQRDRHGNDKKLPLRAPWKYIERLTASQLAEIVMCFHNVIRIDAAETNVENEDDLLAIYCEHGPNEGLYDVNSSTLYNIIKQYDYQLTEQKFNEVCYTLQSLAPRKMRTHNRDLIAVNNGVFDYASKTLLPFSPDMIFITKSRVDYNPNAQLVTLHNDNDGTDWDVESWMAGLSDDPEIVNLLWQMLGAIIRPFVRWNRSIWLYSTTGNNGKGTLCELMRNLCGNGSHTSIKLKEFGKEFALMPLIHSNAIIVDENDVGYYLDSLSDLKAIVTNDIVLINRKYREPLSFRFWGFMVQCINDLPRIRDKSDSFYRRQILVPMDKCFTVGERRYIKDDYLSRREVLEYVLKRVLHDNFYELSIPAKCRDLLGAYKELNDPVREFLGEFADRFVWDLIPNDFIYDLYKSWYARCNPCGKPEGKITFKRQLGLILLEPAYRDKWYLTDNPISVGARMNSPEPLIAQFDLATWKNPTYSGSDINKISSPRLLSDRFRGMVRKNTLQTVDIEADDVTDADAHNL